MKILYYYFENNSQRNLIEKFSAQYTSYSPSFIVLNQASLSEELEEQLRAINILAFPCLEIHHKDIKRRLIGTQSEEELAATFDEFSSYD